MSLIPVIDIANLFSECLEKRRAVAAEICRACENVGFFVVVGHGVPDDIINNVWRTTADFFDSPLEEKSRYERSQKEYPFGYSRLGGEVLSSGKLVQSGKESDVDAALPDLKEMFAIGPSNPAAGFPERIFPDSQEFRQAWEVYYDTINALANKLLCAFALALDLDDENYFAKFVDHHASALRALNYPHMDTPPVPGQLRASAHTDYGTMTILRTDSPGLQVSKDTDPPTWVDAPFVPGAFVINLGDLMSRWTGDRWLSTLHRVVVPSEIPREIASSFEDAGFGAARSGKKTRRQSLAFFHNVNRDAVVSTLPIAPREGQPLKHYEPIVAGEFLHQKHIASTRNM